MKKQLHNLMEIYNQAEEDYELEARKTFTEYLKKQLKKSVKGEDKEKKRCIGYYGAAEPPVRCGESHLSGLTEPPQFVY